TGVQTCALPIFIIFFSRQKKISMESDRRFANSIDLRFPFDISQRIQKNIHFSYSRNVKFAVFIIKKPMFLPAKEKQITTAANPFHRSLDRKSTRLNSSHVKIAYAVFCLKKKRKKI